MLTKQDYNIIHYKLIDWSCQRNPLLTFILLTFSYIQIILNRDRECEYLIQKNRLKCYSNPSKKK